ncbi:MAG: rhomboid family intramembrane serine protease, partial [Verrucomicrobiota bacterium]
WPKSFQISYNAPFTLTFTLVVFLATIVAAITEGASSRTLFTVYAPMEWNSPLAYFQWISHIIGHASWAHFASNFTIILLVGPILEEKYGSGKLLGMTLITALITGSLHASFFDGGLLGASGIAFMMILLSSLSGMTSGAIPMTFVLVAILYGGNELFAAFAKKDQVSQFAHLVGGACGAVFGFLIKR